EGSRSAPRPASRRGGPGTGPCRGRGIPARGAPRSARRGRRRERSRGPASAALERGGERLGLFVGEAAALPARLLEARKHSVDERLRLGALPFAREDARHAELGGVFVIGVVALGEFLVRGAGGARVALREVRRGEPLEGEPPLDRREVVP